MAPSLQITIVVTVIALSIILSMGVGSVEGGGGGGKPRRRIIRQNSDIWNPTTSYYSAYNSNSNNPVPQSVVSASNTAPVVPTTNDNTITYNNAQVLQQPQQQQQQVTARSYPWYTYPAYQPQPTYQPQPAFQPAPRYDYDTGYAAGVAMKRTLGVTKVLLSPIVLPAIFFVGIVLLLFFAVVGSSAVIGNAWGRNRHPYKVGWGKQLSLESTAKLASDVLNSDQCIERLSCELYKKAKNVGVENVVMSAIKEIPATESVLGRIARSTKSANCHRYSCGTYSMVSRAMRSFQG